MNASLSSHIMSFMAGRPPLVLFVERYSRKATLHVMFSPYQRRLIQ